METNLTATHLAVLFGVMVVGASIPSASVLAVSARSAAFGVAHGILASMGIVLGDMLFIALAIYGLAQLAGALGGHFVLIQYLGAAYLIGLGLVLAVSRSKPETVATNGEASLLASFLTGLLITLGDQKAILFYLGFFPAFVDLSALTLFDTGVILAIAAVAVGVPKLAYAFMADRSRLILKNPGAIRLLNIVAGAVMVGVGALLAIKA
ncbi:MAG: hypothetical protein A2150_05705 [Candidatus Muproteobacteria bacterium RBG_16_64_11]|uniref:Threonine transporter n=1 Tax=Candidatus Muproteobacteria bacterium RBG_16_64_11 TaxID=1817758 RepID=A0A1F6TDQ0_9PROT|nr:MAG: hypothetical protein A2150_05705 [Candidatus Muproteobacteria bacterium RBG_16_64_11]